MTWLGATGTLLTLLNQSTSTQAAIAATDLITYLGGTATGQTLTTVTYTLTMAANDTVGLISCSYGGAMGEIGWIGFGVGSAMTDSDIVVVWPNSDSSWTLSHRVAISTTMPNLMGDAVTPPSADSSGSLSIALSFSSNSSFDSPTVVIFQRLLQLDSSYTTASNYQLKREINQGVIYAYGATNPGKDAQDADIEQHALDMMGATYMDLSTPFTSDSASIDAPLIPVKGNNSPSASTGSGGSLAPATESGTATAPVVTGGPSQSSSASSDSGPSSSSGLSYSTVITIHGIWAASAWLFFAPLAVLYARMGRGPPGTTLFRFPWHFKQYGIVLRAASRRSGRPSASASSQPSSSRTSSAGGRTPPPSTLPSQQYYEPPASLTQRRPQPRYSPPPTASIQNPWSSLRPDPYPFPSLSHYSAYDIRPSHPGSALNVPSPLPPKSSLALEQFFASSSVTTAERSSRSNAATVDFAASSDKLLTTSSSATATKHSRPDQSLCPGPGPPWGSKMPSSTLAVKAAASTVPRFKGKKLTVDLDVACVSCGQPIARLILRGQPHDIAIPHEAVFTCARCMSSAEEALPPAVAIPSGLPSASFESPPSFDSVTPSTTTTAKRTATSSFRKKNKRLDGGETLTACDICVRDIATGSVQPLSPELGHSIKFQIEVCCTSCISKYQRCTDCGGGGGARLGTGKWRSKQLFKDGKKTCCLRHQRLGAWQEMEYEVWRITDIPPSEVDELSSRCGEMFTNTMLAGITIPEVLERDGAIWTSFEQAEKHAHLGWQGFAPMFRYDIETSHAIRRYIALRLCPPNFRKSNKKDGSPLNPPANAAEESEPRVLKGNKEIAGYIISEWDIRYGTVFLALVIPWDSTGEGFDATTLLIQALLRRAEADQREMNAFRASKSEAPVPRLQRVFTMIFFKAGSRMITHLTKKRGFLPLEDYLKQHLETDPAQFPPHRPVYLPVERQAGWQVLVRHQKEYEDGRPDDWGARRPAYEERGKKKELKAKALKGRKA
ncbi:hypothetical protein JCM1841_002165 [Sporobolomyces salmonicolor]